MSATTLFTARKYITPDTETVEVFGEISIGDEAIDVGTDVTVEFDEQEHEVEIDEEDIAELYPREARMLLSALLKHHVLPSVRAVAEGGLQGRGDADNWTFLTDRDFRRAMTRMREIIEEAEILSKEGAA
tara:strand:+ start:1084 stop:1473 length:390 start_codon:yes stop_codon:yes gene_type:complete